MHHCLVAGHLLSDPLVVRLCAANHLMAANALAGMLQQWTYPAPMSTALSSGLLRCESGPSPLQGYTSFMDKR